MLCSDILNLLEYESLSALDNYVLVNVSGADAATFLQSQLSNDIKRMEKSRAQLHAYCNVKGRAHCVMRIMRDSGNSSDESESFYLLINKEIAEKVLGILKIYVLRAKVNIDIVENKHCLLQTNLAHQSILEKLQGKIVQYDISGQYPLRLLIVDQQQKLQLQNAQVMTHDIDYYRLHDIYNGIAQIYEASYDQYIPQFLNLDLTDGISFKKGCYPGQEIIARLRYLGKIKQRMLVAQSPNPCQIGDKVFLQDNQDKAVGTVGNYISSASSTLLNIVINSDYLDAQYNLVFADASPILRLPMPYETPIEYGN